MPRHHVYIYCQRHRQIAAKRGSPTQRHVSTRAWAVEREIVEKFLTYHRDHGHGGVHAALRWWAQYIRDAASGEPVPGAREIRRRVDEGIDPWVLLVDTTSVFLFSRWHENRLESGKALSFAISKVVIRYPLGTKKMGVHRRQTGYILAATLLGIGQRVREELGGFMMTVYNAIEKEEVEENERKKVLMSGFEPSSKKEGAAK